jgi:phospholipid/cholesterol/gamma-HCH transport system permease protein
MAAPADFHFETRDRGATAVLTGDWTADTLAQAGQGLSGALKAESTSLLDLSDVGRIDTAGALAIIEAVGGKPDPNAVKASPQVARLLALVAQGVRPPAPPRRTSYSFVAMMERLGAGLVGVALDFYDTMAFFGHLLAAVAREARNPARIRWAACFSLAERAGLDALPIVSITSFFVGAVIGFIGANELTTFGAQVFNVDLIGVAVLREFNIVITAILLAGRSTSSFAAEIGTMKMNQEIDAMQTMGVDPFEALVLPRFVAMLVTIPLLTFVATIAGLAGGFLVCWVSLGLSPQFFFERLVDSVGITHFWVGMSKTPVMAIVIAGIGCRQGMEVGGDVESLGRRVTSAVVQAIFSIILIDAVFALVYNELKV